MSCEEIEGWRFNFGNSGTSGPDRKSLLIFMVPKAGINTYYPDHSRATKVPGIRCLQLLGSFRADEDTKTTKAHIPAASRDERTCSQGRARRGFRGQDARAALG